MEMLVKGKKEQIERDQALAHVSMSKGPDRDRMLSVVMYSQESYSLGPSGEPSKVEAVAIGERYQKETKRAKETVLDTYEKRYVYSYDIQTGKMTKRSEEKFVRRQSVEPVVGFTVQQADDLGLKPMAEPRYREKSPGFFKRIGELISDGYNSVAEAVSSVANAVVSVVKPVGKFISNVATKVYEFFGENAVNTVAGIAGVIGGIALITVNPILGVAVIAGMLGLTSEKLRDTVMSSAKWVWNEVINGPWGVPVGIGIGLMTVLFWGASVIATGPAWLLGIGALILMGKNMNGFVEAMGLGG